MSREGTRRKRRRCRIHRVEVLSRNQSIHLTRLCTECIAGKCLTPDGQKVAVRAVRPSIQVPSVPRGARPRAVAAPPRAPPHREGRAEGCGVHRHRVPRYAGVGGAVAWCTGPLTTAPPHLGSHAAARCRAEGHCLLGRRSSWEQDRGPLPPQAPKRHGGPAFACRNSPERQRDSAHLAV